MQEKYHVQWWLSHFFLNTEMNSNEIFCSKRKWITSLLYYLRSKWCVLPTLLNWISMNQMNEPFKIFDNRVVFLSYIHMYVLNEYLFTVNLLQLNEQWHCWSLFSHIYYSSSDKKPCRLFCFFKIFTKCLECSNNNFRSQKRLLNC